jgi:uncharacterized membrane protein
VDGNLKVAGAHRALSWLYAFCSVLLLTVFLQTLFANKSGDRSGGVFLVLSFALAVFALHRVAARGAAQNESWARTLSRVIAVLLLLGFPIGTAIGLYILYNSREKRWPLNGSMQKAPSV